jgi:ribose 1,5-bisphosphokinase PhnN
VLKSTVQTRRKRARGRDNNSGISAILARSRPNVTWETEVT